MTNQESETQAPRLRKGNQYELTAESAAFEGGCVARYDGMAVFLSGCVPGDTVLAQITRTKQRYAEGRTVQLLQPSPHRVSPECQYFGTCGGCKWQNLEYSEQLRWKRQHVLDAFQRIGGLQDVEIRPTIGCPEPLFYRNKMEFSFADQRWLTDAEIASGKEFVRDFALGLHVPGRYDKVLDIEGCFLQSELSNQILNATRAFALENSLAPYNFRTHTGLLRNLVIRTSRATGETMVILVTNEEADEAVQKYTRFLRVELPQVTTIVQGINRKKAQIAFSDEVRVLHGSGTITETVAGNRFSISPFSFFQTNSLQANRLYQEALNAAEITASDNVWDLYCGAGTITLAAARQSGSAVGIELNEGAVADARENAKLNGVDNAQFIAGDLKDVVGQVSGVPDVVITDPPRAGMHEDVVRRLMELGPRRISYVSCNPTTQARDCAILAERYSVDVVQPVDMFPQTYHIETVARLTLR
ncbi:MAG: 23S rRNA (uracil(1939)-C(5))-methyltransferase RlmD [Armatimonadetes bacterium]|nr:23S rRNA (uracil(1939)-C(5))-methyltransferase RlmD [Armatimonadota bacterium]